MENGQHLSWTHSLSMQRSKMPGGYCVGEQREEQRAQTLRRKETLMSKNQVTEWLAGQALPVCPSSDSSLNAVPFWLPWAVQSSLIANIKLSSQPPA